MMGSRSGSIDPGILIHLLRRDPLSVDDLDRLLNQESGLKGISGLTNDMRQVREAAEQGSDRTQLAFDMSSHSLCRHIGAMLGSRSSDATRAMGGVGVGLVFAADDIA